MAKLDSLATQLVGTSSRSRLYLEPRNTIFNVLVHTRSKGISMELSIVPFGICPQWGRNVML